MKHGKDGERNDTFPLSAFARKTSETESSRRNVYSFSIFAPELGEGKKRRDNLTQESRMLFTCKHVVPLSFASQTAAYDPRGDH